MRPPQDEVGKLIRSLRRQYGLTQRALAELLGCPQMYVSRVETGYVSATIEFAQRVSCALSLNEKQREQLLSLAVICRYSERTVESTGERTLDTQTAVFQLERHSERIRSFDVFCVPGLLQLPQYARAVGRLAFGPEPYDSNAWEQKRLERQRLLEDKEKQFDFVIYKSALTAPIGTLKLRREQWRHILRIAEWPNISIHVTPSTSRLQRLPVASFAIYDRRVIAVETYFGCTTYVGRDAIGRYERIFEDFKGSGIDAINARGLFDHSHRKTSRQT